MYAQAEQDGTSASADAAGEAADMSEDDVVDAEIIDEETADEDDNK